MTLNYIQYFLDSGWSIFLCLLVYFLFLKTRTTPGFKRTYLVLGSLCCVLIPLLVNSGFGGHPPVGTATGTFQDWATQWLAGTLCARYLHLPYLT